jgi:hypothetical protein
MQISSQTKLYLAVGAGVLLFGVFIVNQAEKGAGKVFSAVGDVADAAVGGLTGNNAITAGATNADGEKTTAYQGKGVLGTLGAATNAVSGGYLASIGEWLGNKKYDITH